MYIKRLLLVTVVLGIPALAKADDWPQWRGPERTGISKETGLLKQWPKEGPKLLWQVKDIDYGYSTPSIIGDRIYLLSNQGRDNEFVQALAVKDGKPIWATRLGKSGSPEQKPDFTGARSTPTVDGDLLYALGSDGDLACLNRATGKVRWRKHLPTDFGGQQGLWAYAESPLIDGDVLVCTPGGKKATLVALNKKTGEVIWKSAVPRGDDAGYASAIVIEAAGVKQYVQFLGRGLVGVDAITGKLLWRYEKTSESKMGMNIQTPVAHDGYVYSAAVWAGGGGIRLKTGQEGIAAEQVYFDPNLPNGMGGVILIDGFLYGTTGQGLVCFGFTSGKVAWKDKCVGSGSLCSAEGLLYIHGDNNDVALVEATPEAYRVKGRFTLPDQPRHPRGTWEKAWVYPVVANGRLYIRDLGTLWCYDIKNSGFAK
jgi:outer membrane protein assembly factor BamB